MAEESVNTSVNRVEGGSDLVTVQAQHTETDVQKMSPKTFYKI